MVKRLNAERAIHVGIFMLLLVGLTVLSAWASYTYLQSNLILVIASIPLAWGIILLAMYLSFKRAGWKWWELKS
jgi:quinol-cytochrome oxidoreductase complex cytochrome b subunit